MNCVLFAKMDKVFQLKNTGKVREFCQPGKVGTLEKGRKGTWYSNTSRTQFGGCHLKYWKFLCTRFFDLIFEGGATNHVLLLMVRIKEGGWDAWSFLSLPR